MTEKSKEEEYVMRALISAFKLRRRWLAAGNDEETATRKALKQACGMLDDYDVPHIKLLKMFRDTANSSRTFVMEIQRELREQ